MTAQRMGAGRQVKRARALRARAGRRRGKGALKPPVAQRARRVRRSEWASSGAWTRGSGGRKRAARQGNQSWGPSQPPRAPGAKLGRESRDATGPMGVPTARNRGNKNEQRSKASRRVLRSVSRLTRRSVATCMSARLGIDIGNGKSAGACTTHRDGIHRRGPGRSCCAANSCSTSQSKSGANCMTYPSTDAANIRNPSTIRCDPKAHAPDRNNALPELSHRGRPLLQVRLGPALEPKVFRRLGEDEVAPLRDELAPKPAQCVRPCRPQGEDDTLPDIEPEARALGNRNETHTTGLGLCGESPQRPRRCCPHTATTSRRCPWCPRGGQWPAQCRQQTGWG